MEQRIDPNTKPEFAASTNPSFVPGLTGMSPSAPAPAEAPARAGKEEPEDSVPAADTGSDPEAGEAPEPSDSSDSSGEAPASRPSGEASETDEADGADGAEPSGAEAAADAGDDDGPVFEARDRRGSITAGRDGIVFRLDDQEADFRWDEIGAVETTPARFGRRFTVTVHTAANRWFNADVEADNRARLKEWTAGLDAVLDAYFEE